MLRIHDQRSAEKYELQIQNLSKIWYVEKYKLTTVTERVGPLMAEFNGRWNQG